MNIGQRVKDKQGDEGKIIRQITLAQVTAEEGGTPEPGDEDMFYVEVERPNGTKFFAWEGDCRIMRD
jgi:hypothetical protein